MRVIIRRGKVPTLIPPIPPPPIPAIESCLFSDLEIEDIFYMEPPPVEGEDTRFCYMKEGRTHAVEAYIESGFFPCHADTVVYPATGLEVREPDW